MKINYSNFVLFSFILFIESSNKIFLLANILSANFSIGGKAFLSSIVSGNLYFYLSIIFLIIPLKILPDLVFGN